MTDIMAAAALAAPLFASTNVDDILVLLAFFAGGRYRAGQVVAGQFLGIAVLVLVSLALALLALAAPEKWIGLLGLAPIAIGLSKLREGWGGGADDEAAGDAADDVAEASSDGRPRWWRGGGPAAGVLAVAGVTVANGGDNLGVYTPVFAVMGAAELVAVLLVFAALTGVWCWAGHALVTNAVVGRKLQAVGARALPLVLIGVGVLVLWQAGTPGLLTG